MDDTQVATGPADVATGAAAPVLPRHTANGPRKPPANRYSAPTAPAASTVVTDPADTLRRALSPHEVIGALENIGVDREALSLATGADERTIRRWASEKTPRPSGRDAIDRLRIVVLYLLQRRAMPAKYIVEWLKQRNLELGMDPSMGFLRPLDAIREDDMQDVFAAINALIRAPAVVEPDSDTDGRDSADAAASGLRQAVG